MVGVAGLSGLKPGQTHSGSFQKGYDPRRPTPERYAQNKTLAELARQDVPTALQVVKDVLADPNAKAKEKLTAANIIFDRAYGKPLQGVLVQGADSADPGTMSTADLVRAAERLLAMEDDEAIDAEYSEVPADVDLSTVEPLLLETADYGEGDVP